MSVPDYAQYLTGWRMWRLRASGLLEGAGVSQSWRPKQAVSALCAGHEERDHDPTEAPQLDCKCGWYVLKSLADTGGGWSAGYVAGRCAFWGRAIECTQGWRAQFAYPLEFVVRTEDDINEPVKKACALYGVSVRVMTAEELLISPVPSVSFLGTTITFGGASVASNWISMPSVILSGGQTFTITGTWDDASSVYGWTCFDTEQDKQARYRAWREAWESAAWMKL